MGGSVHVSPSAFRCANTGIQYPTSTVLRSPGFASGPEYCRIAVNSISVAGGQSRCTMNHYRTRDRESAAQPLVSAQAQSRSRIYLTRLDEESVICNHWLGTNLRLSRSDLACHSVLRFTNITLSVSHTTPHPQGPRTLRPFLTSHDSIGMLFQTPRGSHYDPIAGP